MTDPSTTREVPRTAAGRDLLREHTSGTPHMVRHILAVENEAMAVADATPEFRGLIEAEAATREPSDFLSDRGALERACIAVVGPWFDESHERGAFRPMELAQRILHEYDKTAREPSSGAVEALAAILRGRGYLELDECADEARVLLRHLERSGYKLAAIPTPQDGLDVERLTQVLWERFEVIDFRTDPHGIELASGVAAKEIAAAYRAEDRG